MAKAYASRIIDAPVERVWSAARDFNSLPDWIPAISDSTIEDGLDAAVVGCVRVFHLGDQTVRERLCLLDDTRYRLAYRFETPAFPVTDYLAQIELIPVTDGDRTFAQWSASFDEAPQDAGKFGPIISRDVFAAGLDGLAAHLDGKAPGDAQARWQGHRPAKVFCSAVLNAPIAQVWSRVRDFAGMDDWHPEITDMTMLNGDRADKVAATRDFRFGAGKLHEQLTMLCDVTPALAYRITASEMPWLNYHSGLRLYPISKSGLTLAVWVADWTASANDDLTLIPDVHDNVFQKAFDTLNERFFTAAPGR